MSSPSQVESMFFEALEKKTAKERAANYPGPGLWS